MNELDNSAQKPAKNKSHRFWQVFWLTFLVVSLAYAWYSFYSPSNSIKWVNDTTAVQHLSSNSSKNTLIFFTGEWCVPCRIMKREVFADKEVERLVNSQVIPVMVDIDNPDTKELVAYYKIGATPTTVFLNSEGEVLDYAVGKISKKEFLEMFRKAESN